MQVQELMVALGSLFDKKIFEEFEKATKKIIDAMDSSQPTPEQKEEKRRRDMVKTMMNLQKLAGILER